MLQSAVMKLRIAYSIEDGRRLMLEGRNLDQLAAPPTLARRILDTFGEALTPLQVVERIVTGIRDGGDAALERYSRQIEGAFHLPVRLEAEEMARARAQISPPLLADFETAAGRILDFHLKSARRSWFETTPQGTFGQLIRPLERVGLYVPGGTALYPSSVLMTALPAKAAGVKEIYVATPAARDGSVSPLVLAAADVAGVSAVFRVGGAQAIAAMAYGTESIPKVDKILGPGNIFVALAKRLVSGVVGIDAVTGPTETLVLADESAKPEHVAADLLAQAEHDVLAQAVLVTTSRALAERMPEEIERQLASLSRAEVARESMQGRGAVVVVRDLDEAAQVANEYSPEHICLAVREPWALLDRIRNAGGIFLGHSSVEALGDYVSGPSHVMPTGGTARFASPLTVDDFVKVSSLFAVSEQGLEELGPVASRIARSEGLDAHARSVERRIAGERG
ncbi:MAG TPA: histidinol dehydrogenase [Chloroflexota bacterium]